MSTADRERHSDTARRVGEEAADTAADKATDVRDSFAFGLLVTAGLAAYGIVHLAVCWVALQLAWGGSSGSSGSADQQGAMQELARNPIGRVLLIGIAIGLFALVLWRIGLALWGYAWKRPRWRQLMRRWSSAGYAVVYAVLGASSLKTALGATSSSTARERSLSARLMEQPYGELVLILVAAVIAGIGISQAYKGIRKQFVEDLRDNGTPALVRLGQVGHVAKAIAFLIVAILISWATLTQKPGRTTGLDAAFRTIKDQPFGSTLLTILAAGIACYGIYCFGWARRPRRS